MQQATYDNFSEETKQKMKDDGIDPVILEDSPFQHSVPVGYVRLTNGQIVKAKTFEKMVAEGRVVER
jgi:hypothetical protein